MQPSAEVQVVRELAVKSVRPLHLVIVPAPALVPRKREIGSPVGGKLPNSKKPTFTDVLRRLLCREEYFSPLR